MEKRYLETRVSVEYRSIDGQQVPVAFVGEAVVTGKRSHPLMAWGNRQVVETINARALDNADLSDVVGLFNHDSNVILGRSGANTLTLTRSETGGLSYSIPYDATDPDHVRVMRKLEKGELSGSSFQFDVPDTKGAVVVRRKTEGTTEIIEAEVMQIRKLYDVGPVTFPAYPDSKANARGLYGRALEDLEETEPRPDPQADNYRCRARMAGLS